MITFKFLFVPTKNTLKVTLFMFQKFSEAECVCFSSCALGRPSIVKCNGSGKDPHVDGDRLSQKGKKEEEYETVRLFCVVEFVSSSMCVRRIDARQLFRQYLSL